MAKTRILLVDDEADLTSLLALNLERAGDFEVRTVNYGAKALAVAQAFRPDLVLLDVVMPDVDGPSVAAQLQADPALKGTPVVFLTATVSREEASAQQGMIGGHAFLAKPVAVEALIACIRRHVVKGATPAAGRSKKTVLIIDDEADFAALLKANIERQTGYEAIVATAAAAGLALVATRRPDLVLLDIRIPEMDGLEVLKQIKRISPELPVAMVTAGWEDVEAKRCLEAGAYEYITKPVDFEYLKTALLVKLFG